MDNRVKELTEQLERLWERFTPEEFSKSLELLKQKGISIPRMSPPRNEGATGSRSKSGGSYVPTKQIESFRQTDPRKFELLSTLEERLKSRVIRLSKVKLLHLFRALDRESNVTEDTVTSGMLIRRLADCSVPEIEAVLIEVDRNQSTGDDLKQIALGMMGKPDSEI